MNTPKQFVPTGWRTWFETGLVGTTGLLFGVYPEAAIALACICGVWGIWKYQFGWVAARDVFILAFGMVRVAFAIRTSTPLWQALLEALVLLLLPRAAWILRMVWGRLFGFSVLLGLCVSVGFAAYKAWVPDLTVWQIIDPNRVQRQNSADFQVFRATSPDYAWITQSLGAQGPAEITYSIEVKASREHDFSLVFMHPGLPKSRLYSNYNNCRVRLEWTTCTFSEKLVKAHQLNVLFGGVWSQDGPSLTFRRASVKASSPNWINRIRFASRQAGFSFNGNAFGVWIVVAALFAMCVVPSVRFRALALVPVGLSIYLSGSRSAMLAGLIGVLSLVMARWHLLKALPVALLGCVLAVGLWANKVSDVIASPVSIVPSLRAFNLNDPDSVATRGKIWQTAAHYFLSNPMIGPIVFQSPPAPTKKGAYVPEVLGHAHNIFLQMLAEGGLLQLAVWLTLICFVTWRLTNDPLVPWFAPLMAIVIINLGDFFFYYAPVRLGFGLLLGLQTICSTKKVNPGLTY
jgi:hypothetical protein